jgi:hypothetical protein
MHTQKWSLQLHKMLYSSNLKSIRGFFQTCRRLGVRPGGQILTVSVASQRMAWLVRNAGSRQLGHSGNPPASLHTKLEDVTPLCCGTKAWPHTLSSGGSDPQTYRVRKVFVISTSRFGVGQVANSMRTPLGLHRIAAKIGAGQPLGTVFEARHPVGCVWQGRPNAPIAHRILWLEGLEPGFNRGNDVDSYQRYIYIHGVGDETTLGRPASAGCIHMAAADLLPFFERVPIGTLVWIH